MNHVRLSPSFAEKPAVYAAFLTSPRSGLEFLKNLVCMSLCEGADGAAPLLCCETSPSGNALVHTIWNRD